MFYVNVCDVWYVDHAHILLTLAKVRKYLGLKAAMPK